MKPIIEDLMIGDLVRLDNKRVIKGLTSKIEMTFKGKVLCIRMGQNLYDFLTDSFYKEMKRYKFSGLQVSNLLEGELYVKDLESVTNFVFGYPDDISLKKSVLQNIKMDLENRGLCFAVSEKVKLRRIK